MKAAIFLAVAMTVVAAGVLVAPERTETSAATPPAWTVNVGLPKPGYRKADGTLLGHTEFKGTRVLWGSCGPLDEPVDLGGEVMARSHHFTAKLTIPAEREVCIVAVVVGLDGQPMARSGYVRFSTFGPRPASPVSLGIL